MGIERHKLPIRLTLAPGQRGTKKLAQKYGDNLVCVRYRYDEDEKRRYTTVEIEAAVVDWDRNPARPAPTEPAPRGRMGVRIYYQETELRTQVKQIGGIWRPRQRLWEMTFAQICALGLEERIVTDE